MKCNLLVGLAILGLCGCGFITKEDLQEMGLAKKSDPSPASGTSTISGTEVPKATVSLQLSDTGTTTYLNILRLLDPSTLLNFSEKKAEFSLVDASAVTFGIEDCKSGFTTTGQTDTDFDVPIELYQHDKGCVAALESFVFTDHYTGVATTYVPIVATADTPLKGATGATQLYQKAGDATNKVMVKVIKQLAAVVANGDYAMFSFKRILPGTITGNQPWTDYSESNTMIVHGVEAPNAIIPTGGVELTDIALADGVGVFQVTFTCNLAITHGGGDGCDTKAVGGDHQLLADMCATLVEDTYGDTPSYVDAEAATASCTPVAVLNATQFQATGLSVGAGAANKLTAKKNMMLFLKYTDSSPDLLGSSYRYFNIDIGNPDDSP